MKKIITLLNLFLVALCLLLPGRSLGIEDWFEQGLSLSGSKRYEEAIKAFSKAIDRDPRNADAYYNRGIAWYQKGDYGQAIADYTKALEINPNFADSYDQLAGIFAICPDRSYRNGAKAVELAKKAVELHPRADSLNTLAAAYAEAGKFADAITVQKAAISLKKREGKAKELSEYIERLKSYRAHTAWLERGIAPEAKNKQLSEVKTIKRSPAYILERPRTGSSIIDALRAGDKVKPIHQEDGWYIVKLLDGRLGWAHQGLFLEEALTPEMARPIPEPPSQPVAEIGNKLTLKFPINRVRKGPSLDSKIKFLLQKGESVSVNEIKGDWYLIELEGGRTGWAHQSLFFEEAPAPEMARAVKEEKEKEEKKEKDAPIPEPPSQPVAEIENKLTLKFPINRVRKGPSLDSKIKFLLQKGESVSVNEIKGDWYLIELEGGRTGWAHQGLFFEEAPAPEMARAAVEEEEKEDKDTPIPELPLHSTTEIEKRVSPNASTEKILPHPYSIYLGSFQTMKRTNRAISIYSKKGLSPYWAKVHLVDKGVWHRVFTGHFENRDKADRFIQDHGLVDVAIKKTKYATLIGTYASSDELENQILSLKNLGYSPYLIEGHNGKSRLFVGAFLTRAGAERQRHELKSSGIQSEIVKR